MTEGELKLISARDAAKVLGVNPGVIYALWKDGRLDYWEINRTRRTNLMAIEAFLERTKNINLQEESDS